MPAQQQIYVDKPSPISQAVQIWGEGPELSPYATYFKPPVTFTAAKPGCGSDGGTGMGFGCGYGMGQYGGYTANDYGGYSCSPPDYSLMPTTQDLEWIAGDTAMFQFYFAGVAWTEVKPGPDQLYGMRWTKSKWEAQVRSKTGYYYQYWWPPQFPGYRWLMTFECVAHVLPYWQGQGPGTLVVIKGATIWPGDYVWDLQTKQWPELAPTHPIAPSYPTMPELPTATPHTTDPDQMAQSSADGFHYPPKNGIATPMMPIMGEPRPYMTRTWISGKVKVHPQVTQDNIYPPSHWPVYTYPRSAVQI